MKCQSERLECCRGGDTFGKEGTVRGQIDNDPEAAPRTGIKTEIHFVGEGVISTSSRGVPKGPGERTRLVLDFGTDICRRARRRAQQHLL